MQIKKEIRILGWDDAPFKRAARGSSENDGVETPIIGVITRGGSFVDGVLRTSVQVDGTDATERIATATKNCRHKDLRVVMLNGITYGGFNTVNIKALHGEIKLPVIAVTRKRTKFPEFKAALKRLPHFEERWAAVEDAGEMFTADVGKPIYFQVAGITEDAARKVIKISATRSLVPEPLRIAHLMATALVTGESIGRA